MSLLQRILASVAVIILAACGLLFLIFSHQIFKWLGPAAQKWRDLPGGWAILWAIIFLTAFPPIIGYSTALTLAGFVFGMKGWFIAASANIVGSFVSFLACRTILSSYVHKLIGEDKRFHAFGLTLKHDGLKILIMIRLCPLPYALSNAALSTFPTLHPFMFTLATVCACPKLLVHVFVGSRLASLAESGEKMDPVTKAINFASVIGGGLLGAGVGYVIYQRTVARARQLELEESQSLGEGSGDYLQGEEEAGLTDAAGAMNDDDLSLWDNDEDEGYRDESTDEESEATGGKDKLVDEEAALGLKV